MKLYQIVAVVVLLAFAGCAQRIVMPGDKPDATPPKIVLDKNDKKVWDRPGAFGPIPANQQARGKKECGALKMKAVGYHPYAQNENGNTYQDGGFLCIPDE
jgi:hypothetical protein